MPSPVGHSLAGLIVAELFKPHSDHTAWQNILLANAPDIDMLPGLLDRSRPPDAAHGKASHSLGAAVVAAGVVGGYDRVCGRSFRRRFTRAATAYASHLFLDYLGKESKDGMPLLWPLSDRRIASRHAWFRTIVSEGQEQGFWRGLLTRKNLRAVVREVSVLLPALWLGRCLKRRAIR